MPETDTQKNRPVEAAALQGATDLYEDQLDAYRESLERGLDVAARRFGYALYHSLRGSEVVQLRQKMGFQPQAPTDFYNLGAVAAENENFTEAAKLFQKALEADPELAEAEFNLALALENSGEVAAAKKIWSSYMKRDTTSETDRTEVAEHLKSLG